MYNNSSLGVEDEADLGVELYVCSPDAIAAGTALKILYIEYSRMVNY